MEITDDDVVGRVRGGDVDAYRILLDRYYSKCLRYGIRILGNRADAEEAVQDAFARAYRFLPRYEARDRFEPWLFQILVNQVRSIGARERKRDQRFVPYDAVADFLEADGAEPDDPRLELQRALAELSDEDREALLMKYMDDRTYEDMAELTGLGVSALKMRVMRARTRLGSLLKGVYDA